MFYSKCEKDLQDCECPDLEERLNKLKNSPYLAINLDAIIEDNKRRRQTKKNVEDSSD